ncbi:MAG: GYD domain-containing protein [Acidobacteriaceae bacterium]|nr:GYD domain-containing protein [Acidobacteriaceae bacterium]MBV9778751.1 GYD domain-containing protein [Acidobacteriaceae bacterium]
MASYLIQVSYTPEAWASLVKNPHDRAEVVGTAVQKLGGRIERFWMSFGEYDVVGVAELPNNVAAAAFAMAVAAGGACRNVKTTPLLTTQEGLEALKQAATSGYKPVTAAATA